MVLWYYFMSTGTFYMSVLTVVKIYYCSGTGCALSYHEKLICDLSLLCQQMDGEEMNSSAYGLALTTGG